MKTKTANTSSAAGSDAGAAKTRLAGQAGAAANPAGAAGETKPAAPNPSPAAGTTGETSDVSKAALVAGAAQLAQGRPQAVEAAREGAAGSATDAPSVGAGLIGEQSMVEAATRVEEGIGGVAPVAAAVPAAVGPVVEVGSGAGLPPGTFSELGAHGPAVSDIDVRRTGAGTRRLALGIAPRTGVPLPVDRDEIEAHCAAGYDIIIVAKRDGFRRAGLSHPAAATIRRSADFDAAELEMMAAEPMLVLSALR